MDMDAQMREVLRSAIRRSHEFRYYIDDEPKASPAMQEVIDKTRAAIDAVFQGRPKFQATRSDQPRPTEEKA